MYQRILVPIDGSPTSNAGLAEAMRLAKVTGAQLRLLHVVDPMPFVISAEGYGSISADAARLLREAGQHILQQALAQVEDNGMAGDTVLCEGPDGRVCDRVVDQAKEWGAELIVLGTHGRRGVGRMLLGSDAEQILRTAPVPVLLVRSTESAAMAARPEATP